VPEAETTSPATIAVTGAQTFRDELVAALRRRGAAAVELASADERPETLIDLALPHFAAVVHVCGDDDVMPGPIATTDAGSWRMGCEAVLRRSLMALQTAHRTFSGRGGHVVMITSTAGLSGAPHASPLLAALEGTRSMAKSAARQWGADGITVNCIAVPLDRLAPTHAGLTPFLPPPSIARHDIVGDVAAAVEFLISADARGVTGTTVLIDGGSVMAP
jgi:3-oxoacyl-[acyl-carrier protein] reductase